MDREPLLRHVDALGEAGFDHPPTDAALEPAKRQNEQQLAFVAGRNAARSQK